MDHDPPPSSRSKLEAQIRSHHFQLSACTTSFGEQNASSVYMETSLLFSVNSSRASLA